MNLTRLATFCAFALAIIGFVELVFGFGENNLLIRAYDVRVVLPDHMKFFKEAVMSGRLPLWSPHTFSGSPFLASPTTRIFYPTSLLFLLFQPAQALPLELTIHLFIAATGVYLLARISYGISRYSSLFAGLIYTFSGGIVGHAFAGHSGIIMAVAYIPLLAFVVERAIDRLKTRSRFRTVGTNPWLWLGGFLLGLQLFTGGLPLVWLGIIFIGLLRTGNVLISSPSDWRAWGREGFVLAAITTIGLMIAAVQFAPSYEFGALSDRPRSWDYARQGSFRPAMFAIMLHPRAILKGNAFFWEYYGYIGVLPLALAFRGLLLGRRDNRIIVLACVGIGMLLFMLGENGFLYPLLWKYVPTFDIFKQPTRAVIVLHLVIALLAAFGLDAIIKWLRRKTGLISRSVPVVVIAIFIFVWTDIVSAARWYEQWLLTPLGSDLITSADNISPKNLANQARRARILKQDTTWYRYWFYGVSLRWNYAFEIGAHNVGGYDVMMLNRYSNFLHHMTDSMKTRGLAIADPLLFDAPTPFPFKILGLKYVDQAGRMWQQTDPEFLSRAWFVTVYKDVADEMAALNYMHNDDFKPHSEVVFEADTTAKLNSTVRQMNLSSPESGQMRRPVQVTVTDLTPEELLIDVSDHPAGFIVLSEIYYPGWQAEINGVPVPVHRCNSILRCLELDDSGGTTTIRMSFRPATVRWGMVVSITSLIIVACAFWLGRVKRNSSLSNITSGTK